MERQPREGETLPNERARLLKPYACIEYKHASNLVKHSILSCLVAQVLTHIRHSCSLRKGVVSVK